MGTKFKSKLRYPFIAGPFGHRAEDLSPNGAELALNSANSENLRNH